MRMSRGFRSTFGALAVVVLLAAAGYAAYAGIPGQTGTRNEATRAMVAAGAPTAPATAYVEAPPSEIGTPSASSAPPAVPATGPGTYDIAPGGSAPVGTGRIYRYLVKVEQNSGVDPAGFAAAVEETLAEPRGWTASRRWGFQRVSSGASDFTIHLATPGSTDRLCDSVGVETNGEVSCRGGRTVVINLKRWQLAVPWYADALPDYRDMVVNHEVGHFLGHGHAGCAGAGKPASVMQTQTLGLRECVRNPWPYPDGQTFVTGTALR